MKKTFILSAILTAFLFISCGPSAEEEAKIKAEETAKLDSIFKAASQSMSMDSTNIEKPDSTTGEAK